MVGTPAQGDPLATYQATMKEFRAVLVAFRAETGKLAEKNPELARRFNAAGWHLGLVVDLLDGNTDGESIAVPVAADLIADLYRGGALRGVACERFISEGIRFLLRCGYEAADFGLVAETH